MKIKFVGLVLVLLQSFVIKAQYETYGTEIHYYSSVNSGKFLFEFERNQSKTLSSFWLKDAHDSWQGFDFRDAACRVFYYDANRIIDTTFTNISSNNNLEIVLDSSQITYHLNHQIALSFPKNKMVSYKPILSIWTNKEILETDTSLIQFTKMRFDSLNILQPKYWLKTNKNFEESRAINDSTLVNFTDSTLQLISISIKRKAIKNLFRKDNSKRNLPEVISQNLNNEFLEITFKDTLYANEIRKKNFVGLNLNLEKVKLLSNYKTIRVYAQGLENMGSKLYYKPVWGRFRFPILIYKKF
ncbi:MAG: hypothetical protein U0V72_11075 [Cytophagales bacterium]